MNLKGLILFDIDGVIRDVSASYRLAIQETVAKFCNWKPSFTNIDELKAEGSWNNDWDVSMELIKRHIHLKKLSIKPPKKRILEETFNDFYFGGDPSGDPSNWHGFINNESLLVTKKLFTDLTKNNFTWGFVSGAERSSANFILEKRLGLQHPPLIAMGEAPEKPNPIGLIRLSEQIFSNPLGSEQPIIVYLGDTVADVLTIARARAKVPSQRFLSFALAPPHLHTKETINQRLNYENTLRISGADCILKSTKDIVNVLEQYNFES